jgi:hypothetical protein
LADDGRRVRMGQSGRRRVEDHFTFAAQARQYQALFERLTGKRSANARADATPQAATISA